MFVVLMFIGRFGRFAAPFMRDFVGVVGTGNNGGCAVGTTVSAATAAAAAAAAGIASAVAGGINPSFGRNLNPAIFGPAP